MTTLATTVERLCRASEKDFVNPYDAIEWTPALDRDAWHFSPELISIEGTGAFACLSEAEQKRLAFYEAVNFFSLNIHGERALMEGIARRLYRKTCQEISPYLHHFLDEENKHMTYFGGFCLRYAGKIYPDRKMGFPHEESAPGAEDFLFFAKALIFEEIVDIYNTMMARDGRLSEIARRINLLHHRDETRHLAFGRQLVRELFARHAPGWSAETLEDMRAYLASYLRATWREYYNPDVYRDAGLGAPFELMEAAFDTPASRARRERTQAQCVRFMLENEILAEAPGA